jgi:hypothetical protein
MAMKVPILNLFVAFLWQHLLIERQIASLDRQVEMIVKYAITILFKTLLIEKVTDIREI